MVDVIRQKISQFYHEMPQTGTLDNKLLVRHKDSDVRGSTVIYLNEISNKQTRNNIET